MTFLVPFPIFVLILRAPKLPTAILQVHSQTPFEFAGNTMDCLEFYGVWSGPK